MPGSSCKAVPRTIFSTRAKQRCRWHGRGAVSGRAQNKAAARTGSPGAHTRGLWPAGQAESMAGARAGGGGWAVGPAAEVLHAVHHHTGAVSQPRGHELRRRHGAMLPAAANEDHRELLDAGSCLRGTEDVSGCGDSRHEGSATALLPKLPLQGLQALLPKLPQQGVQALAPKSMRARACSSRANPERTHGPPAHGCRRRWCAPTATTQASSRAVIESASGGRNGCEGSSRPGSREMADTRAAAHRPSRSQASQNAEGQAATRVPTPIRRPTAHREHAHKDTETPTERPASTQHTDNCTHADTQEYEHTESRRAHRERERNTQGCTDSQVAYGEASKPRQGAEAQTPAHTPQTTPQLPR